MCLLTITSHHHEHRSHNLATFHHSKVIDRQLPAPSQYEIHGKHGTRVTVRNLFGNLPVRVKQRAVVAEHKMEHDRLWEILKREVTHLLLSWRGEVSLRLRDADGRMALTLSSSTHATETDGSRSSELYSMLNVLTQANYILTDEWASWVPTSASTSTLSIKGAISLDPAPSKRTQFISLGIRPLSAESGHNELSDEVNRIFSLSSFGTIEDDADVPKNEKIRRQGDKRFKNDGYMSRQLRARKGVDRYPMFHLRISLEDRHGPNKSEDQLIEDDTSLQAVMEVLNAMITQWLSVHHFRPRKPRTRRILERTPPISTGDAHGEDSSEFGSRSPTGRRVIQAPLKAVSSQPSEPTELQSRNKRERSKASAASQNVERSQTLPFSEWSRIKSGKAEFFDALGSRRTGLNKENTTRPSNDVVGSAWGTANSQASIGSAEYDVGPVLTSWLSDEQSCSDENTFDKTVKWTNIATKQTSLHARNGCILPLPPKPSLSEPSIRPPEGTLKEFNKRLLLQTKPASSDESSPPWLNDMLETWDNPVFKAAEKGSQQLSLQGHQLEDQNQRCGSHLGASNVQIGNAFNGSPISSVNKLSRAGLQNAQILAQLDKKFILAKMRTSMDASTLASETESLVLIDQHAADERIRVEALLLELCAPLPKDHANAGYCSKLGHRSRIHFTILEKPIQFAVTEREFALFIAHAATFAAWAVLYHIESSKSSSGQQQQVMSVVTLPTAVSERCKADPQALINLLRSTVWKYADARSLVSQFDDASTSQGDDSASWVRRLSTCPEGFVDLINSRACRSAIMFNDELSLDECEELVKKLVRCVFPFMCAHGRPSMVPILELGALGGDFGLDLNPDVNANPLSARGEFVKAWKRWRGK